jgi:hypothetical protein
LLEGEALNFSPVEEMPKSANYHHSSHHSMSHKLGMQNVLEHQESNVPEKMLGRKMNTAKHSSDPYILEWPTGRGNINPGGTHQHPRDALATKAGRL